MISKRQEKILRQLHSRHGRKKSDAILVEGVTCCREALQRRPDWLQFMLCSSAFAASPAFLTFKAFAEAAGVSYTIETEQRFASLAATENPQGILCVMRLQPEADNTEECIPKDPFVLILDRMMEPGNVGTVLRTAWAAGLQEVWITAGSADPFSPKCIRSGMGAQFAIGIRRCESLAKVLILLQKSGYSRLWLARPDAEISCFSPDFILQQSGLVIGNEAHGIRQKDIGTAVSIPMPGQAESLNAAQAAGIFIFEGVRRGILGAEQVLE